MSTLLYLLLNLCLVLAQDNRDPDPNNHFIYPPLPGPQYSNDPTVFEANLNFTIGKQQSQPFKWVTNMTDMQIILCQEGNPDTVKQHAITQCVDGNGTNFIYWDGDIGDIDLDNGAQAYLGVWNCSDFTTPVFFSHYMNLVEPPPSSSSSISTSTQTSSASTSPASTAATAPTTSTEPPAQSPTQTPDNSSSGSSNAAALGGGIGGGIGGALLLIGAAFAFWKYRNGKNQAPAPLQPPPTWGSPQDYNAMSMSPGGTMYKAPDQPTELYTHPQSVPELHSTQSTPGNGAMPTRPVYEM
ncbi:hypothetical protein F5Y04DRAFT_245397 [Hypomontagnella monticulosa]|nr:hypothetical protein F5Y04DRAFT_245397 [Hypomontagnella monticulosa]